MELREASAHYLVQTEQQQVPKGYKQTEVGVIPEDWVVKAVHEFAAIKTGPFGTLLKASEYSEGGGVPLISVGEIRKGFLRITDQTPRVSEVVTRRLPQYILKKGDIVFGRKGGVERSALIRQHQEGWFLGSDGISIRPSHDCHDEYLARQFQSARVQGCLLQNAIGTTMPSLNQEILRNVAIPFPPTKAEQKAIAKPLSDADALIESLEQLIAKKCQIKQGAMQELLTGKRRLPGFENKCSYKQTEIGVIPGDWELSSLGQIGTWKGGATPSMRNSAYWANGTIPWVSSGDVKCLLMSDAPMKITSYAIRNSSTTLLPINSVIIVTRSGILRKYLPVAKNTRPLAINQDIKALIPDGDHIPDYLFHLLVWSGPRILATCLKSGTTVESVEFRWLKSFLVPIPPTKAEQEAIAAILSNMDAEIAVLEAKLAKARQIKQGMMQKLLTGRIRLVDSGELKVESGK